MKIIFIITAIFFYSLGSANEVNLFTTRHYESDVKLYSIFTKQTGIKVNIITGKSKPLEKRIIEEGQDCKGDLFFIADAGRLVSAEKKGIFRKVRSKFLEKKISNQFRSPYWFGITKRARILFYNPESTAASEIENLNYEDLSSGKFLDSIAIRQSNNVYNQSLVASLIENNGIETTKLWIKGVVKNFSRSPTGNDRAQILSVAAGESKIAVANTYYYALMASGKKGEEQQIASQKVKPLFPNQGNRGTHMNISGIGILKYSPNSKNAIELIKFLLTPEAQKHIVNNTYEYPIIESVKPSKYISQMGLDFKQDKITKVSSYGKWQKEAFKLMQSSGWN